MWMIDDKSGSLLVNTEGQAYMGEHIIIVTASYILDVGRGTGSINYFSSTFSSIFQPLSNKIGRGKNLACVIALNRLGNKNGKNVRHA